MTKNKNKNFDMNLTTFFQSHIFTEFGNKNSFIAQFMNWITPTKNPFLIDGAYFFSHGLEIEKMNKNLTKIEKININTKSSFFILFIL